MKRIICSALFLMVGATLWASQEKTVTSDSLQLTGDLKSYGGIMLLVTGLIGFIKSMWRAWVDGKEPIIALGLTIAMGVAAKLLGNFQNVDWVGHSIALLLSAGGAGLFHDKISSPIIGAAKSVSAK